MPRCGHHPFHGHEQRGFVGGTAAGVVARRAASAKTASNPAICVDPSVSTITLDPVAGSLVYSGVSAVSIVGNGTMILGNNTFTLLRIGTTVPLTVDGLSMTGGQSAIEANDVTISNSTFSNNAGIAVRGASIALVNDAFEHNIGGGVQAGGAVTAAGTTFTDNGGGALSARGSITVTGSTFSGNMGGAIVGDTEVRVADSTFSDNSADVGGAVFAHGTITVTSSTFAATQPTSAARSSTRVTTSSFRTAPSPTTRPELGAGVPWPARCAYLESSFRALQGQ